MHAGLFTTDQPSALFPFHTLKDANIAAFRVQSRDGQTDQFLDALHILGRSHFTREVMLANLLLSPLALKTAIGWIAKKLRKENLLHSFCLILCMENRFADSTDPARWNDPLMKYQGINYRVSLLREAAFHGFSHQASMTFQVIIPKQLRYFKISRHRLQSVYPPRQRLCRSTSLTDSKT